ncbi:MAG: class B sortase [Coriobacteriales bacterium]|jgi:sortase B|nr:class B sortase [Coriobacteriales bacterium]
MSEHQALHRRPEDPLEGRTPSADPRRVARSRKRSRLLLVIGIVCLVAALAIAAYLVYRYQSASVSYDRVSDVAGVDTNDPQVAVELEGDDLKINWDALHEINPDIVAWVLVPGTRINYPITQASDNDYYLNHLFDKGFSTVGSIFLDYQNSSSLTDRNTMIYGHNMMDGSMFAGLRDFAYDQAFFNEHRTVLIATPAQTFRLTTVAVVICEGEDKLRQLNFPDETAFANYLTELLGYAVFTDEQAATEIDRLYCLATCTDLGNSKRIILLAKPLDEPMGGEVQ